MAPADDPRLLPRHPQQPRERRQDAAEHGFDGQPGHPSRVPPQPRMPSARAMSPTKAMSIAPTETATARPFCVPSAAASMTLAALASPKVTRVEVMRVGSEEGNRILA